MFFKEVFTMGKVDTIANAQEGNTYAIVLAGGRGSRLPIAGSIPKQFAPKFEGVTFVQDIVRMISQAIKPSRIICIVTCKEQEELAIKQLTPSRASPEQGEAFLCL